MAEARKSLWVQFRVPMEAAGAIIADLSERVQDLTIRAVSSLAPSNTEGVQRVTRGRTKAAVQKKVAGERVHKQQAPKGQRTSDIAEELFQAAGVGGIVTRSSLATAFKSHGYSEKSAQTFLDRSRKAGRVKWLEAGKYEVLPPKAPK